MHLSWYLFNIKEQFSNENWAEWSLIEKKIGKASHMESTFG